MRSPSSRPPSPIGLAFWWMVFAVCGGLAWGSPLLLISGLAVPPLLLALWVLRRV